MYKRQGAGLNDAGLLRKQQVLSLIHIVVAVLLTLLVLLQFPADFGSVAHAAQKNEIRGTISVASNISQQDMQQYLDGLSLIHI